MSHSLHATGLLTPAMAPQPSRLMEGITCRGNHIRKNNAIGTSAAAVTLNEWTIHTCSHICLHRQNSKSYPQLWFWFGKINFQDIRSQCTRHTESHGTSFSVAILQENLYGAEGVTCFKTLPQMEVPLYMEHQYFNKREEFSHLCRGFSGTIQTMPPWASKGRLLFYINVFYVSFFIV